MNPKYQSICGEDLPITENLFGGDLKSKLQEAEIGARMTSKNYRGMKNDSVGRICSVDHSKTLVRL